MGDYSKDILSFTENHELAFPLMPDTEQALLIGQAIITPECNCQDTDCQLNCIGKCQSVSTLLLGHDPNADSCEYGVGKNLSVYHSLYHKGI